MNQVYKIWAEISGLPEDDIQFLMLKQYSDSQKLIKRESELGIVRYPIRNGRVLGVVAGAALGALFLPGLIGVSVFMGALIGAAIGWRLFGSNSKKQPERNSSISATNTPGFDSPPSPPTIGGTVPVIFTNTTVNTNGGLSANGNLIHSRIETFKGRQTLFLLRSLGFGQFGTINTEAITINGLPKTDYFLGTIDNTYTQGLDNQSTFSDYQVYSQAIAPQNNNQINLQFVFDTDSNIFDSTTFNPPNDSIDAFEAASLYSINNTEFNVIQKNREANQIVASVFIPNAGADIAYKIVKAKYTTSKRVTRVDFNFRCDLFAIENDGEATDATAWFILRIDNSINIKFFAKNKGQGSFRRSITIRGLSLEKHTFEFIPYGAGYEKPATDLGLSLAAWQLDDSGIIQNVNISGSVFATFESRNGLQYSDNDFFRTSTISGIQTISTANRPAWTITSINEIVLPSDLGQPNIVNYRQLVLARTKLNADESLNGNVSVADWINFGLFGDNHKYFGTAKAGSTSTVLNDSIANFVFTPYESGFSLFIQNLENGIKNQITSFTATTITTGSSMGWSVGDRYIITFFAPINYFPDIFVYLLLNPVVGLGQYINYNFIDYLSIVNARNFVVANNFFWDGAIDTQEQFDDWLTKESLGSLLFPTKFAGTYGLLPEQATPPTSIYSSANIIPGSFELSRPDPRTINTVKFVWSDKEEGFTRIDRQITVFTSAVANGTEAQNSETLQYKSITNLEQAKTVAGRYLKSRIIQDSAIKFKTGIQGFKQSAGDLIVVQYAPTELEIEFSAFCTSASSFISPDGIQSISLSKPFKPYLDPDISSVNVYHLEENTVETELSYTINPFNNTIQITGLVSEIKPVRDGYSGDIICINRSVSEKIYRISEIRPQDYEVEITAIFWSPDILDISDLTFIE